MIWIMTFPKDLLAYRIIRNIFKSVDYIAMLQDNLVPCMGLNYGDTFYIQKDNCRVHKAKIVKDFITTNHINVLEWPAKFPYINIVEDVWKLIFDIIYDRSSFQKKTDLKNVMVDAIIYVLTKKMDSILELYKGIRKRLCIVL